MSFLIRFHYRWWWIVSFKLWSFYTRTPPNRRSWTEGKVGFRARLEIVSMKFLFLMGNQFFHQITLKFQPKQTCSNRPAVHPPSPATDRITITVPLISFSRQRWRKMYLCEQAWKHYHFESNIKNLISVLKKIPQCWTSPTNQLIICNALHVHYTTLLCRE